MTLAATTFKAMCADARLQRRCRTLSAATFRATRYAGTARGARYANAIGRVIAELTAETAVRYGAVDGLDDVRSLVDFLVFDREPEIYVRADGLHDEVRRV